MTLSSVQWAIRTQAGDAIADIASTSAHRITKQNMIDALYQEEYEIPQTVLTRIGVIESAFNT